MTALFSKTMKDKDFLKAKVILDKKLAESGLRRTVERHRILEEIYARNDHFQAEEFYDYLRSINFPVSRATVYNVLDLLVELKLVTKHQFAETHAFRYEKAFGRKQHSHLICVDCHKVLEFCDPRLQVIQDSIAAFYKHSITDHSLVLYGQCERENCKKDAKSD